jgi:uncharacterized protein YdaU (DUF1376 family)
MNWYPRYMGDYIRDTAHLTMTEHGAYTLLLDHYYSTGQPLPADDAALMRICRAFDPVEQSAVLSVAGTFFPVNGDGKRHNNRADKQLLDMTQKHNALSEAGKRGMAKRWKKTGYNKANKQANNPAIAYPEPEPEPDTKGQKPEARSKHLTSGKPTAVVIKTRNPNPVLDAMAVVECGATTGLTTQDYARIGKALKTIREASPDVTPEEIARRARNYRTHFDNIVITASALAKHWARCKSAGNYTPPPPKPQVMT